MNIIFSESTKKALLDEIEKSSYNHIRVKVVGVGCGKVIINEVKFTIAKKDEKLCNDIEIKYDKEIYNKGFYVRSL